MKIRTKIREWYRLNKRTLPWREITDPYRIWISEIILQQTRVNQGMDYYYRFLEAFPDLKTLALAGEDEVLKVWEGLGYYSRARNMHSAAKYIYRDLKGEFPDSYDEIIKLRGVGPYTAAAVSSMAFGEPRAAVDGNVHRVLSRLFGIKEPPGQYLASSRIISEASRLLDRDDPGTHNQALMELGALICKPAGPDCLSCPLQQDCYAFRNNKTDSLPLRPGKIKRRKRYFHYLFIRDPSGIWLKRRSNKDIWEGLYEFPLIETSRQCSVRSLMATDEWKAMPGNKVKVLLVSPLIKHVLSHQDIHARIYHLSDPGLLDHNDFVRVNRDRLTRYPLPKLILNYLNKFNN